MLGGADNPNGELLSYIIGADICKIATNSSQPFWMFGGVVYKNKQARRYGYACAGHARRDAKIRADYV